MIVGDIYLKGGAVIRDIKWEALTFKTDGNKITSIEWTGTGGPPHLNHVNVDEVAAVVTTYDDSAEG